MGNVSSVSVSVRTEDSEPTSIRDSLPQRERLYVLSANDEYAGMECLERLRKHLTESVDNKNDSFMSSLAQTLAKQRSILSWKTSMLASSLPQLISGLRNAKFTHAPKSPTIGLIFTGQGAQWYAMARSLLTIQSFRKTLLLCNKVLVSVGSEWSVIEELCRDESSSRVNEASLSQPLCTIIQIALVDLLRSWDIVPSAVVGHSSGEIAAAYASGLLTLEDAVTNAYYRGFYVGVEKMNNSSTGAMAAVRCSTQSECSALLDQLSTGLAYIACHNSPHSFTVSGDETAISELIEVCSSKDIWARKLLVDVPYHTPKMQVNSANYWAA